MKLLSLFSGIGAFEAALDNIGIDYELVGYCEIDKYASKSYSAIHGVPETMNFGDITKIDEKKLPRDIDLITYGFPCQDISLAGKQKGLFNEDGTQTRSGLFFEALRIIEETQPKIAIAENVKNLVGKKFKEQFEIVLNSLEQAGYNNYWKVLNAKDFGIPQNRERVFIVSIRKDVDTGVFEFPEGYPLELRLKDLLEDVVDEKYYIDNDRVSSWLRQLSFEINDDEKVTCLGNYYGHGPSFDGAVFDKNGLSPTLLASNSHGNVPKFIVEPDIKQIGNIRPTKTRENPNQGRVYDPNYIAPSLNTCGGGNLEPHVVVKTNGVDIQKVDIPQTVKVRKYPVDTKKLSSTLRMYKDQCGWTNKELAEELELPVTTVEHWFRTDGCFAIPEPEVWEDLKWLLEMDDVNEFDESIMTFEEVEGVYDKAERHYLADGIAPTLTSTSAAEKIIVRTNNSKGYDTAEVGDYINIERPGSTTRRGRVGHGVSQTLDTKENHCVVTSEPSFVNGDVCKTIRTGGHGLVDRHSWDMVEHNLRIRKLTPKECFRLMGFDDADFEQAASVNSNTQLYKQAGNSIVVDVLEELFCMMFDEDGNFFI